MQTWSELEKVDLELYNKIFVCVKVVLPICEILYEKVLNLEVNW